MDNGVAFVLHNLELIQNDLQKPDSYETGFSHLREDFETLKLNLLFLKTFLLCSGIWSNDQSEVRLRSFLSKIEATVNRPGMDIKILYLRAKRVFDLKSVFTDLKRVVSNLLGNIKSFNKEIIDIYETLSSCSSSESRSRLRDCELVDFIDSVLQNLVNLLSRRCLESMEDYNSALALEDKLTFLKNFIGFAKFLGVEERELEDLLAHIQVVALNAAGLTYKCLFYKEDEEMQDPKMCSIISELLEKINPVDLQVYETYVKVLKVSKSPKSLLATQTDMQILQDFSDSLRSSLWELLGSSTSFAVSVKDQMQKLYAGLRFLRSILKELPENMNELNDKIVAVISEAGIVIFSLFLNGVKEVDVDSLVVGESADCCTMLVNTNKNVTFIVAQLRGSSISGSLPSYHSFRGQEACKTTRFKPPRGRVPITNEIVVGFDDDARKVINRLKRGSATLEIVPIVGMPGLGKTTLAKKVYNSPSVEAYFYIRLWCSFSQEYDTKNSLVQILSSDGKQSRVNEELKLLDEYDLAQKLRQMLMGKRYLIVLDDVWDIRVWHGLSISFPDNRNGSRVLITSRQSNVASEVQFAVEPYNLRILTEEESWELFQRKVFGEADCPQPLCMPGKKIATNCKGLPLTIVIIAEILSTIKDDAWSEVADSLTSTIVYATDQCKNTLELSYRRLPHHLKPCLLYFGAFREDQEIETAKLMRLWIAEGFVPAEGLVLDTEPKRIEALAEEYMMDLIGRNLVMVAKQRHIGGVKTCRIHGLLHEFCKEKAKEENFLQVLHGYGELSTFNEHSCIERLSIWSKVEHFKKSMLFCPQICSLLLFSQIEESDSFMADISFVFCIYKSLRVLDLEQIFLRCKVFPREVEALVKLRYLGVQGAVSSIPPSIEKLSNLETFVVIAESGTVSLPDTIWNMTKLRHLHVVGRKVCCSLPSENLGNTSDLWNLDTFSTLIVSLDDRVENIMRKIPNVRQLKIQLSAGGCSTGNCNISHLTNVETLEVFAESSPPNPVQFSFPLRLKELVLGGLHLPWSRISVIEELRYLEVLVLLRLSFVGERWELTPGGFRELRCLILENLGVVKWEDATDSGDAFLGLQKLRLSGVLLLEKVPSRLQWIPLLEEIEVRDCTKSLKKLVHKIGKKQKDWGNMNLKIID
ncbi:putative late blight resistance protein homolog R1B-17 [Coffea eugenioides]|uniref:putative late blight resistance protein homolog R1B-17 n=1 Tax=Coffea eugenioides TaxID=49369 RepID=UPI000F60EF79|nr:putative late blight resistance protein homolog R1B-17 [Coffea eugenioides]XP_027166529.1 putative late blight resistance protein homolog R1B-17 [Coffea eugenioides]XP_027174530.1 putative late blight resistance protein homolog R1B-17 [Coffea eugenioides]